VFQANNQLVICGRIGAPYGLRGWVKVTTFTEAPDTLLAYRTWMIGKDNAWQEMTLLDGTLMNQSLRVHFAGIDDCNQARMLTGKDVAVPRSALPEPQANEVYWVDLPGLQVINQGTPMGVVQDIFATGANDVLVIETSEGQEVLVPYIAGVIEKVALDEGVIYIAWHET